MTANKKRTLSFPLHTKHQKGSRYKHSIEILPLYDGLNGKKFLAPFPALLPLSKLCRMSCFQRNKMDFPLVNGNMEVVCTFVYVCLHN